MTTNGASTMPKTEYVIEPGKQEIVSTTVYDAPRELVFKAYTDPKLLAQWFGPRKYETKIYKFEPHSGGSWRMSNIGSGGEEHIFRGVNHDVVKPERICSTWEYEGVPGHVMLNTTTFEELGNKTRTVEQMLFQSVADRDGMVASGMQSGADESVERLVGLLEQMKTGK
jgi:uncharacterized protein YndB with AHSA1/START domain